MYHPTARVLTVLELLQAHGRIGGAALAERLEVDRRTVRRYIITLQDLGIPIEAERGRYGAYRLRPGFKLPPLMFTDDEALALTLGLIAARQLRLAVAAPATEGALAKLQRVMPETLRDRLRAVSDTLVFDAPLPETSPAGEVVVTLSSAVRECRRVWLRYNAWDGAESEREVDPYGLVYRRGRWFLAAWCHLRHDLRVFRLDRIACAEPRAGAFTPPANFDTHAFVMRSLATMPSDWQVEVLLDVPLTVARQYISPDLATLDESPECVVVRCEVADLDWFAGVMAGWGFDFTIRQPHELRDALRRQAARLAALASR
ncbi:MAG: helix-turn-helix transcriptional regulator [Thermomicrobiales bacterium]